MLFDFAVEFGKKREIGEGLEGQLVVIVQSMDHGFS